MAKAGSTSRLQGSEPRDPEGTRRRLVAAAIAALREVGYAGASAREIARRAECNQALVFYHFGSVADLLLAALDETSRVRMEQYSAAVDGVTTLEGLVAVGAVIFAEDLDAGHVTVLAEMIAGASSSPELGAAVTERIETWRAFTEALARRVLEGSPFASLVDPAQVAFAVVALYLGIELLTHLDGDRRPAEELFASAGQLAALVGALSGSPGLPGLPGMAKGPSAGTAAEDPR
jgi:AcrR family transcriptional regulator